MLINQWYYMGKHSRSSMLHVTGFQMSLLVVNVPLLSIERCLLWGLFLNWWMRCPFHLGIKDLQSRPRQQLYRQQTCDKTHLLLELVS